MDFFNDRYLLVGENERMCKEGPRAHLTSESGRHCLPPAQQRGVRRHIARELVAVEENLEDTSKSVALPVAEAEPSKEATAKVGGELPTLTAKQKQPPARRASREGARRRV